MEKILPQTIYQLLLVPLSLYFLLGSISYSQAQSAAKKAAAKVETEVFFPSNLNSSTVDFNLKSTGNKKFKVILDKKGQGNTKVKIYDILGNLIKEDKITPEEGLEKSFDFSQINSQLFVVEVGNSKYNKTKSIYAQPPGQRRKVVEAAEK